MKKITRKVISKAAPEEKVSPPKEGRLVDEKVEASSLRETSSLQESSKTKRACFFCQGKTNPSYTNIVVLRRFVTDRAKIVSRIKDNLCSKHQRLVAREVKHARHLALLPFIPKV